MTMKLKATPQVVEDYKKLFVNRRAYTMQSLRPHPQSGRHYYFRPNKRGTDVPGDVDRSNHTCTWRAKSPSEEKVPKFRPNASGVRFQQRGVRETCNTLRFAN